MKSVYKRLIITLLLLVAAGGMLHAANVPSQNSVKRKSADQKMSGHNSIVLH